MQVDLLVAVRESERHKAMLDGIVDAAAGQIRMVVTDISHLTRCITRVKADVLLLEHETGQMKSSRKVLEAERACTQGRVPELLLCRDTSEDSLLEAVRLGARGCVTSDLRSRMLAKAVLRVAQGQVWFSREWLLRHFGGPPSEPRDDGAPGGATGKLTPRQREIIALIGGGLSNKEIARRLGISDKTVQTQLHRIYVKLDARGRYKAFAIVNSAGAGSTGRP